MKPAYRVLRMTAIGLLLAGLVSLSGCIVTNKVLDLRKERETRVRAATNFWSLSAVRSVHATLGGEPLYLLGASGGRCGHCDYCHDHYAL